ncbi:MAG: CPBP family intramembrane metalloprotease [Deltaproteobacteria bacterium]|nr:CPBP family intramembrane metalloprotease [Deltaproteobacteria bacterium]
MAWLVSAPGEDLNVKLAPYTPLHYLVVWAPALAALFVIGMTQGTAGLRSYARRLLNWRVGLGWYAFVLFGIPGLYLLAAFLTWTMGEPAFALYTGPWSRFVFAVLLRGSAGPVEEFGWRGFALPLLQRSFSGLVAAVILGLIWGVWHLPAFLVTGFYRSELGFSLSLSFGSFLLQSVAVSIIMTFVYNGTGGNIPLPFLIHWLVNFPYPWEGEADPMTAQALVLSLAAIALAVFTRTRYLGSKNLYTDVAPQVQ